MTYSKLVNEHLETYNVTHQYLMDTDFTLDDLNDIAESPYTLNKMRFNLEPKKKKTRHYISKPKLRQIGKEYEEYRQKLLQKA